MRIACCITQATGMHTEYVMLIAFPQQLLRDRNLVLRLYIYCLLFIFASFVSTSTNSVFKHPVPQSTTLFTNIKTSLQAL
jgi:hypothetical protein